MTRAQWSHSTEHSGHPVRSTPPERTRHVLAGHLLRSGPTHNHWHATQNSLTILEPVHTRSGLKCCRDGFLPTGTHTGQQLGCCALGPPCLAQARPRPMKGHINFSGSGLNDRVMASEPMTMGWNVQPCPLPLLIFFFLFFSLAMLGLHCLAGFSLVVAGGGHSLVAVHRPLTAVASLAVEQRHSGFRSCSTRAQQPWLPLGMWDLPKPGIMSPALAARFFITDPPRKPRLLPL